MKIVILANDIGDKLWPLTSSKYPKALLPLYSENPMLTETIRRCAPLCGNKGKDMYIVASAEAKKEIKSRKIHSQFKIPLKNIIAVEDGAGFSHIVGETVKLLADSPDESIVSFVPSDQFYWPEEGFIFHLSNTIRSADDWPDDIIMMCMVPGMAAANMNYVAVNKKEESIAGTTYDYQSAADGGRSVLSTIMYPAVGYVRGTTPDSAEELMNKGYVWDLKTVVSRLKNLRQLDPKKDFCEDVIPALCKKGKLRTTIANKVIWSVLDNWAALKYLTYDAGLFPIQEDPHVHTIDATGNLVKRAANKEVILIGVEDLIIVETEDKLLVATPGGAYEHL
jgi:mannose-1-phosphate guanylyltransferase